MQHILSNNTLTVIMPNGIPRSLHRGTCNEEAWERAIQAVVHDDFDTIESILDKPRGINRYFESEGIEVRDGVLYYDGRELNSYAATKAIQFVEQDLPAEALINFLKRVEHNPSYRAVQDLYSFLEFNNMPLTPEGCFMAYKKVRKTTKTNENGELLYDLRARGPVTQFVDIHTGQICNDPGEHVSMARNQVDEDPERTCSYGLHVCSYDYLPSFGREDGDTVVMVSVDPADVVAIPKDYNNAKMRVCAYRVVREIPEWRGHTWDRAVVDERPEPESPRPLPYPDEVSDEEVERLIRELNAARDQDKIRFHEQVAHVARTLDQVEPLSIEMRVRFLLENGYSADSIRDYFHD